MKPKSVLTIIVPNVQALICGVWRIDRAHDLVTLTYTDGSRRAGRVPISRWKTIHENPFAIVEEVEAQQKKQHGNTL